MMALSAEFFICSKCGKQPPEVTDFSYGDGVLCVNCKPMENDPSEDPWIPSLAEGFRRAGCSYAPIVPDPDVIEKCIGTRAMAAQPRAEVTKVRDSLCQSFCTVLKNSEKRIHCAECLALTKVLRDVELPETGSVKKL